MTFDFDELTILEEERARANGLPGVPPASFHAVRPPPSSTNVKAASSVAAAAPAAAPTAAPPQEKRPVTDVRPATAAAPAAKIDGGPLARDQPVASASKTESGRAEAATELVAVPAGQGLDRRTVAETSRRRIETCSGTWYEILDLGEAATAEEVKRCFHELALLHHPDKSGSTDDEIFKKVQQAYEEGLQASAARARALALPKSNNTLVPATGEASDEAPLWPLSVAAPKARLRKAVDQWEHAYDVGESPTVPDEIQFASLEEMAEWLMEGECIPVDTREEVEVRYEKRGSTVPGSVAISFGVLRTSPEQVVHHIGRFRTAGKRVVAFSTNGGTSGNCGMCCALLADVFGLDPADLYRLDGGFAEWAKWAKNHRDIVDKLPTVT